MKWIKEIPKEDGWYWVKGWGEDVRIGQVINEKDGAFIYFGGDEYWRVDYLKNNVEWAGPIMEPGNE